MLAKIGDWFEERSGLKTWLKRKQELPIPSHMNFFYCFGGISFTIIILQLITGLFMAFFYIPRPEEALNSILRFSNEVTLGWFILLLPIITAILLVFHFKMIKRHGISGPL